MKILIVGANSFIARSIAPLLSNEGYDVTSLDRGQLDLLNVKRLDEVLSGTFYDTVINCSMSGKGRLIKQDSAENFYENILIHENLLYYEYFYGRLIDFSSGAQWDRSQNISNVKEDYVSIPPNNFYSLAKNVNALRSKDKEFITSLRIFNAFGPLEDSDRFIRKCMESCFKNKPIEIWGNAHYDFFYVGDLAKIVIHYMKKINHHYSYNEVNCVYKEKFTLFDIARIIKKTVGSHSEIIVKDGINKDFTGNGDIISNLNLSLIGLTKGIEETWRQLQKENKY